MTNILLCASVALCTANLVIIVRLVMLARDSYHHLWNIVSRVDNKLIPLAELELRLSYKINKLSDQLDAANVAAFVPGVTPGSIAVAETLKRNGRSRS
jgi:hypothetical protein